MEARIIPIDSAQKLVHTDFGVELFADFTHQGLFGSLSGLDLPAGELPPAFPLAIAPPGGKNLVTPSDNGCNYMLDFHFCPGDYISANSCRMAAKVVNTPK